ncbi:MAG: hypothetical protein PPP58_05305 [Natronomonas sp.]
MTALYRIEMKNDVTRSETEAAIDGIYMPAVATGTELEWLKTRCVELYDAVRASNR